MYKIKVYCTIVLFITCTLIVNIFYSKEAYGNSSVAWCLLLTSFITVKQTLVSLRCPHLDPLPYTYTCSVTTLILLITLITVFTCCFRDRRFQDINQEILKLSRDSLLSIASQLVSQVNKEEEPSPSSRGPLDSVSISV